MKIKLLLFLLILAGSLFAQDISMTFSSADGNYSIDSITAMNIRTLETVSFAGNETLILGAGTSIDQLIQDRISILVYPNPSTGQSTISINIPEQQDIIIYVRNQLGQLVSQKKETVQVGPHTFLLSLQSAGIYFVTVQHSAGHASLQIVTTKDTNNGNSIITMGYQSPVSGHLLKTSVTSGIFLDYMFGDPIRFFCKSGVHTTIFQEQPREVKDYQYDVDFYPCIDRDGRSYQVVLINNQVWMAENLSFINEISPPSVEETNAAHCYVYGYDGNNKPAAKATEHYATYGVLYNWIAANSSCPSGWHLSTDEEWKTLESFLGMSDNELDVLGTSVGRYTGDVALKLKSTDYWEEDGAGNDLVGFNLLPGGWSGDGYFQELGIRGSHWTSFDYDAENAIFRTFSAAADGNVRTTGGKKYGASVRCVKD